MTPETIIDLIFTALVTGILGALPWTRLNRLECRVDAIHNGLAQVRGEMATRADLDRLREEMDGVRGEMATRADLDRLGIAPR